MGNNNSNLQTAKNIKDDEITELNEITLISKEPLKFKIKLNIFLSIFTTLP